MKKNSISMKQAIFYILYKKFKEGKGEYVPVYAFMGETFIAELNKWGYVSHECSARASEMFKENPGLLNRARINGKSGAMYYGYRISPDVKPYMIKDPSMSDFYGKIAKVKSPVKAFREDVAKENKKFWDGIGDNPNATK